MAHGFGIVVPSLVHVGPKKQQAFARDECETAIPRRMAHKEGVDMMQGWAESNLPAASVAAAYL
eukprot:440006-Prorocentrum_lima.AAC.1